MSGLRIQSDLVRLGLKNVLKDEGFKNGRSKANAAIESAECVLHWASQYFITFSDKRIKPLFSKRTFFYAILMAYPLQKPNIENVSPFGSLTAPKAIR